MARRFFSDRNLHKHEPVDDIPDCGVVEEYDFDTNSDRLMKIYEAQKFAPPQKSDGWLMQRWNLISASDASCASDENPFKSRGEFIMDKAKPYNMCTFKGSAATRFGERYEPIADYVYERLYGIKLYHMNLVVHPVYPFLGASIDGLAMNKNYRPLDRPTLSPRPRINLTEFKVPKSRAPHFPGNPDSDYLHSTNHVKKNYWVQTQLQMEVLDVPENDYLDLKVVEPATIDHLRGRPNKFCGYSFANEDGEYIYSFDLSEVDRERYEHERPTDFSYWNVEYYHLVTIYRNRAWFAGYLPLLQKLWRDVLAEREFDL